MVITAVLTLFDVERQYRDTKVNERAVYVDRPKEDRAPSPNLIDSDSSDDGGVMWMILGMSIHSPLPKRCMPMTTKSAPLIEIITRLTLQWYLRGGRLIVSRVRLH